MIKKPLISICIPTYNRSESIKECLDSLVCQFDDPEIKNEVEIVISDNASVDDTQELIQSYLKKFDNIRYSRNEVNLGYDRNVDRVIGLAQGKYCWMMSDDDWVEKSGSIKFVLNNLRQYPDIRLVYMTKDLLPGEQNRLLKNGEEYFATIGWLGWGLSCCIYNKEFLPKDRSEWFVTSFIALYASNYLASHSPVLVVKNIFRDSESETCEWAKNGGVFLTHILLKRAFEYFIHNYGYNKEVMNKHIRAEVKSFPHIVASARLWGMSINRKDLALLIKEYYQYPTSLLLSLIAFFCPVIILKKIKPIYNYLKN